jgi:hypothetical protein
MQENTVTYRYQIILGSESGHCCFEFTVIDTERPVLNSIGEPVIDDEGRQLYEPVCECFEKKDAVLIRNALNAT